MRKAAIWAEVDATMEVAKMATDLAIEACEDASACTEALATATTELRELRTENMRLRHQARETAAIHDRLAAELVTVQGSVDRLLAQCVRQRALLDDLRTAPVHHGGIGGLGCLVRVPWQTCDALHAIGGES